MNFEDRLAQEFPYSRAQEPFLDRVSEILREVAAFEAANTLACVGLCRDEICQPFAREVARRWGEAFSLGGLAGLLWAGRTGFAAALSHAPQVDGRERFVFFAMPHLGLGPSGEIGLGERRSRPGLLPTCGALVAFHSELESGRVDTVFDVQDAEQSLLKQRLLREIDLQSLPDLLELTRLTQRVILTDLEALLETALDPAIQDWAVISGIQIHGPGRQSFVWPGICYAQTGGDRVNLAPRLRGTDDDP